MHCITELCITELCITELCITELCITELLASCGIYPYLKIKNLFFISIFGEQINWRLNVANDQRL
jgi:hypothetical protein